MENYNRQKAWSPKNNSKYPLVVLYTSFLARTIVATLQSIATTSPLILQQTTPLSPKNQREHLIAARFEDTWTKLCAFEPYKQGYERMVFLDADMLVLKNMDELFEFSLPGKNWIAASHACVCNLDHDSWAPEDWKKENCSFTGLKHPECLKNLAGAPKEEVIGRKSTHTILNSGLFLFEPTAETWAAMLELLNTSPLIREFMFPDQDFLAEFFRGKWKSLAYQYNALKTMRYRHPEMWRNREVKNVHYIVDKPWSKRVGKDGIAGYLGRDGVTHTWWWEEYDNWEKVKEEKGENYILEVVRREVAKPLTDEEETESIHVSWTAGEDT